MRKIILALLLLTTSHLFATSDHYSFVYIPISDPQEGGEIKLHKAIFLTWYAEPDFSLSTVTHPYIVNAPHNSAKTENQYQNLNINLASIKGLFIDLSRLYDKDCEVSINASKVRTHSGSDDAADRFSVNKQHLAKVLKAVEEATRLNLQSHKLNCKISIKK